MVGLGETDDVREDYFGEDALLLKDAALHGLLADGLFGQALYGV